MAVEESPTNTFLSPNRNRCCFQFPCFGPAPTPQLTLGGPATSSSDMASIWDRIRVGENDNKWWARPITAFKKVREWSEIVAGPKWKTFIRRFNRRHRNGHVSASKFQYDPLSYALNFDEGHGQNGHFVDDDEEEGNYVDNNFPDFTSRLAASASASARSSVDISKVSPAS